MLHFYRTYLPDSFGGIERVIWSIAEGSAAYGVESDVLSLSRDPERNSVCVGRHFAHKARLDFEIASTGLSLSALGRFKALTARADLVHYHFPWPFMDVMHFATRVKKPSIVTYHSDVVRQKVLGKVYLPLMNAFLGRVDRIVATSPNYLQTSSVLQRFSSKVSIIPTGLTPPPATVVDQQTAAKWRARLGERFFLFVGELRYYKGLSFLVEAARATGYSVAVVGQGRMLHELERTAPPNLHLLGRVSDEEKDALLQLCFGFVFPSHLRSEAFGVALLEAAFAGKPMISCEIGTGTSYVNADRETGLVIPPADSAALAQAMTGLWNDGDQVSRFGRAARERASRLFSAAQMSSAYFDLYQTIVANAVQNKYQAG